jgi:putative pyruvate formate lyase activating enzyme
LNGCRNINLVGGEPTCWLPQWLNVFKHVDVNVPIVWNSNAYYSNETACLLAGFADVYLLDFKYGPENCAARISDAPHYWEVCTRNHFDADKYGELIVRILVLPGHLGCCTRPTFDWIASNLGKSTRINVMFQYFNWLRMLGSVMLFEFIARARATMSSVWHYRILVKLLASTGLLFV